MPVSPYGAVGLIFLGSLFAGITAIERCAIKDLPCDSWTGWAVACGVISAVVSVVHIAMRKLQKDKAEALAPILAAFYLVWWTIGVAGNTAFQGPFPTLDNVYLGSWAAFLGSLYFAYYSFDFVKGAFGGSDMVGGEGLAMVFAASWVEWGVAADALRIGVKTGDMKWALACGLIAWFICLFQIVVNKAAPAAAEKIITPISAFLLLWWIAGLFTITSASGAFGSAAISANGYFSCWIAMLGSGFYAYSTVEKVREVTTTVVDNYVQFKEDGMEGGAAEGALQSGHATGRDDLHDLFYEQPEGGAMPTDVEAGLPAEPQVEPLERPMDRPMEPALVASPTDEMDQPPPEV